MRGGGEHIQPWRHRYPGGGGRVVENWANRFHRPAPQAEELRGHFIAEPENRLKQNSLQNWTFSLHWLPCHCMALIFDCQKLHQYFTTSATLLLADLLWTQFPSENSKGKALISTSSQCFCWKNILTWSGETDACWFLVSRNVCRGKLK